MYAFRRSAGKQPVTTLKNKCLHKSFRRILFIVKGFERSIMTVVCKFLLLKTFIVNIMISTIQFARIHTSSLIKIEKILNRSITKFYNSDGVNVIAAELRLPKTRPTSLYKRQSFVRNNANRCK